MTIDSLGIAEARSQLGTLVARAVHGHQPTTISRSTSERAVLISEADYEALLRARQELEAGQVREAIAARERGESTMHRYESRDELYADFGLAPGDRS
ncbi:MULTISPECIES: type II toxin-antitoxin system Phd/YefM family antitoxin [Streptosporangium]|uniref:Antitoxin n=1 Tax=Streptosporangium brasiliense TaxID=47480 RepID=A0ABT9RK81_9ACTN|nr:type II toxin-antitoxin system Phd/YefM family antitoxin [Streptosporangium brasiliense]MDP9869712.1 prevent-host-death family protein [Streptosporangium brasiliense]